MKKIGKQFTVKWNDEKQQRINRFYISNKGSYIYKIKPDGSTHNIVKGFAVTILNKVDDIDARNYDDINYNFYISECEKIINNITPKQLSLFI